MHVFFSIPNPLCFQNFAHVNEALGSARTDALTDMPLGPEVIKLFSCSSQLNMKIFLLIKVKMPTDVGILTFMIRKNSILGLSESGKS